jgi:hypothetical protein
MKDFRGPARPRYDDLGRLRVSVTSDSGVASIRAHIVSCATQQEVAVTDGFEIESSDGKTSTWLTNNRFQLAQLGGYRVDIELTDNDGQQTSRISVYAFYQTAVNIKVKLLK